MESPISPPIPSLHVETGALRLADPSTGQTVPVADMRAEFERLSQRVPRDPEAERAFIESKLEIVRNDPNLNGPEKERAIEELRRRLLSPGKPSSECPS